MVCSVVQLILSIKHQNAGIIYSFAKVTPEVNLNKNYVDGRYFAKSDHCALCGSRSLHRLNLFLRFLK